MESNIDEFDDLAFQLLAMSHDTSATEAKFLEFVESTEVMYKSLKDSRQESAHLQNELIESKKEVSSLHMKLSNAKELLNLERNRRLFIEKQKVDLESQISTAMGMLGQGQIDETKEKLQGLSSSFSIVSDSRKIDPNDLLSPQNCLSTINEHYDSFESVYTASDIDLTGGEELEISKTRSGRVFRASIDDMDGRRRKSGTQDCSSRNKQFKYEPEKENIESHEGIQRKVVSTPSAPNLDHYDKNQLLVPFQNYNSLKHLTPIQETRLSHLRSTPVLTPLQSNTSPACPFSTSKSNSRFHNFTSKTIYWTDFCQPCGKRIKFGKTAYKCKECRITCHHDCRELAPMPCIPAAVTPASKGSQDLVSDFAPSVPPCVPAMVVYCTNEIEKRGLSEVGVYRVPGSEKDVKDLKERFMKGKGVPNLSQVDVHVVAGALKDFLRSLKEPLITYALWKRFIATANKEDKMESMMDLYNTIGDLPQANRDTLAWMICHLHRVAESPECKMPIYNLSRVFGPTIIGYSSPQPSPATLLAETAPQQQVMKKLLDICGDYWSSYLTVADDKMDDGGQMARSSLNIRRRSTLHKTPLIKLYTDVK